MWMRIRAGILMGTVAVLLGAASSPDDGVEIDQYEVIEEGRFRDTTVRVYRDMENSGGGYVVVEHGGVQIGMHEGHLFQVEHQFEADKERGRIEVGRDITGDGRANMVIHEWTGGAHCCFTVRIYDIEGVPMLLDEIDGGHGGVLVDLDRDGSLEFQTADWTFAYWRTSFAYSPVPRLVLRYDRQSRKYVVACDLMMMDRPNEDRIEELIASLRARQDGFRDTPDHPEYLKAVVSLMYSGHEDLAWTVAQRAWTGNAMGYAEFVLDLDRERSRSRWWPQIQACVQVAR